MLQNKRFYQVIGFIVLLLLSLQNVNASESFLPKNGDLIFVDLNCGTLCDGISAVTDGIDNFDISHVGIVIKDGENQLEVIEAIGEKVVETPLKDFLARSLDEKGKPRAIVGRMKQQYQILIPAALKNARNELGDPYNASFYPDAPGFYCSQLIFEIFKKANDGKEIFHMMPMTFYLKDTQIIAPAWRAYYKGLGIKVPQGLMGINPGALSRSSAIDIIYQYGNLRNSNH